MKVGRSIFRDILKRRRRWRIDTVDESKIQVKLLYILSCVLYISHIEHAVMIDIISFSLAYIFGISFCW